MIEQYMENSNGRRPIVKEIRNHLLIEENMNPISGSTIIRILKKKLNYRFKKLSTVEGKTTQAQNIRKFYESALVQLKLEDIGYELIFIDEFSISSKYHSYLGWPKVGEKGYLMTHQNSFSMYFIIALSAKHFYAIKGSSKAMDSSYFTTFIKELLFFRK